MATMTLEAVPAIDLVTERVRTGPIEVPMLRAISIPRRATEKPIIPEEPCCASVCKTLNNIIENRERLLERAVETGAHTRRTFRGEIYEMEALKQHRYILKLDNICKCAEESKKIDIGKIPLKPDVPIIREKEGIEIRIPSPRTIRRRHLTEKSIVPTHNACCPKVCEILNNEIDKTDKILDTIELRGGLMATHKNARYEAYAHKANALKDYRKNLDIKTGCKCVKT